MHNWTEIVLSMVLLIAFPGCTDRATHTPAATPPETSLEKGIRLAHQFLIIDTHIDIPSRLDQRMEDISVRTPGGDFDEPRAKEGGLNAPFMSIYVSADYQESGGAKEYADKLIDMVERFQEKWPDKFTVARSVFEVRSVFQDGRIALPMGMENGAPIEGSLANLHHFYERGIRYITLTHSRVNHIADSSYDSNHRWKGLSPFGRKVVAEMNRLGMMVDISHASDEAFHQVVDLSSAPVIASHSSCRHFTPGWERNMSDDMIRKLAENGGVIQISFGSSFISDDYRLRHTQRKKTIDEYLHKKGLTRNHPEAPQLIRQFEQENPLQRATVSQMADHIDHVKNLVGVDHVGFGSDFDGVGDTTPTGLRDVSEYPNLLAELLDRGYTEEEIEKICSGNLLRVWAEVERVAAES